MRAFQLDATWERFDNVVLAGSPLRVFRVTAAGAEVLDALEEGRAVSSSGLIDRLLDAGAIHPLVAPDGGQTYSRADVSVVTPQFGGTMAARGRLVVDDGSDPPLEGAALRLERNCGPAAARNAGRDLVSTELIAFVDADVDTGSDVAWIDPLLGHFDDPSVALVAPRVTGEDGSPLDLGDRPGRVRAGSRISYVPSAAFVVRTRAFDAIGGFDAQLRFGEDVDLVWRLDQAGWRCRFEPGSVVRHRPRATLLGRLHQHRGYGTAAGPLAARHPQLLAPVQGSGWTAAVWAVALMGHPVAALGIALATAARLPNRLPGIPRKRAVLLALDGHVRGGQQLAQAARRAWWPLLAVASLLSRRMRWIAAISMLADPRRLPTDVAYGWGVWSSMRRLRTVVPIMPRWRAWPGPRRANGHARQRAGASPVRRPGQLPSSS